MSSSDPISADPDDAADADRLHAYFSTASAPDDTAVAPAPGPGPNGPSLPFPPPPPPLGLDQRPAPTGPPVFNRTAAEPAAPDAATVQDVAGLVRYLDAQLELTRRRSADQLDRVVATLDARLAALDARLGELTQGRAAEAAVAEALVAFRNELFAWLEGYVDWEASRLSELDERLPGGPTPRRS